MGDHYCCIKCDQHYDYCKCGEETRRSVSAGPRITELSITGGNKLEPILSWNDSFLQELAKSKEVGEPTERFCDLIAEFIRKVYERKQDRLLFLTEEQRDTMFVHATCILIRTWNVFKPEKSNNAMAFYHTAIYGAFINFTAGLRR